MSYLSVFLFSLSLFATVAIVIIRSKSELVKWRKFWSYFVIVHLMTISIVAGNIIFVSLTFLILVLALIELFREVEANRIFAYLWFLVVSIGTLRFALEVESAEQLFVYILVSSTDGFSQIFGRLFGRRKIFSNLSPNKTLEGAIGGIIATTLVAVALRQLIGWSLMATVIFSFVISSTSIAGDLIASWIKRSNNLKDFGKLLPGQGGILDRFDSFITTATIYWFIKFCLVRF